jgi:hypothetical protein
MGAAVSVGACVAVEIGVGVSVTGEAATVVAVGTTGSGEGNRVAVTPEGATGGAAKLQDARMKAAVTLIPISLEIILFLFIIHLPTSESTRKL